LGEILSRGYIFENPNGISMLFWEGPKVVSLKGRYLQLNTSKCDIPERYIIIIDSYNLEI